MEGFPECPYEQWRRFSDFETLWRFLNDVCPQVGMGGPGARMGPCRPLMLFGLIKVVIPPLPDKKINFKLNKMGVDRSDPEFLRKRQAGLHAFVTRVVAHPVLNQVAAVRAFITVGAGASPAGGRGCTWLNPRLVVWGDAQRDSWRDELTVVVDGAATVWSPSAVRYRTGTISLASPAYREWCALAAGGRRWTRR